MTGVQVWGSQRRVLFFAQPDEEYKAFYGNADAQRPTYDIDRLLSFLDTEDLPVAELGAQTDNPMYVAPVTPRPPLTERLPWLLPVALALAALLVGGLLLNVLRKARSALPPRRRLAPTPSGRFATPEHPEPLEAPTRRREPPP